MTARQLARLSMAALVLLAAPAAPALESSVRVAASGKPATETRTASGFTGIALAVPGTLVVRQGTPESVIIEADDNLLPEIETVVEAGTLKIRYRRGSSIGGHAAIRILVTGPAFDSLAISGGGEIIAATLKSRTLSLSVGGAGDMKIARLEVDTLSVSIAGSGDVRAAGHADEVTAKIAGSGDLTAPSLQSQRAKVSIAGSGNALLSVRQSLDVHVSGSGDVRYYGDPVIKKAIAGTGSVKRLGNAP